MDQKNNAYAKELDTMTVSLEKAIDFVDVNADENRAAMDEFVKTITKLEEQLDFATASISQYKIVWQNMPSVEQQLNQAKRKIVRSISDLNGNFERHKSIINRSRHVIEQKLALAR